MGTPFMGELRIMSFNFAPKNWALCNGQLLAINQNQALFSLLGTTYGGNGTTNFALPDLRTRTPLHVGQGLVQGEVIGQYSHTLTTPEMPQHIHFLNANTSGAASTSTALATSASLLGNAQGKASVGTQPLFYPYSTTIGGLTVLDPHTMGVQGGSQPHENRQPFLVLNVCIALQGMFPSRN